MLRDDIHSRKAARGAVRAVQALLAVPGVAEVLEGLAAYTQNHFARVSRLQRSAYLLDYTLASMDVLTPAAGDAAVSGAGSGRESSDAPPQPSTPPQHPANATAVEDLVQPASSPVDQPSGKEEAFDAAGKEQQKREKKKRQSAAKKRRKSEADASLG